MQRQFFAHRRTFVALAFAGLALLVFAPESYGRIPGGSSSAVRERSAPDRLTLQVQRESIPEPDTHVTRVDAPTASDWSDELVLGTGLLAALMVAGGMTLVIRHRRTVSTIR